MANQASGPRFVDFIHDITNKNNRALAMDFLLLTSVDELDDFFSKNGYTDIGTDEIKKILEVRKFLAENVNVSYGEDYY